MEAEKGEKLPGDWRSQCVLCGLAIDLGITVMDYSLHLDCAARLRDILASLERGQTQVMRVTKSPLGELRSGDHAILTYRNEMELEDAIAHFVKRGIEKGRLNLIFASRKDIETYTAYLRESGVQVEELLASRDLVIVHGDEFLRRRGELNLNVLSRRLEVARELGRKKGKSGLNILGTIAFRLSEECRYDDCVRLERFWHEVISRTAGSDMPITLVCPYVSVPADLERPLQRNHNLPLIALDNFTVGTT